MDDEDDLQDTEDLVQKIDLLQKRLERRKRRREADGDGVNPGEPEKLANPAIALGLAKKRKTGLMKTTEDLTVATSPNAFCHSSKANRDDLIRDGIDRVGDVAAVGVSNDDVFNVDSDVDSDDSLILPTQIPSTSVDNEGLKRRQKRGRFQRDKNDSKSELDVKSAAEIIGQQALDPTSPEFKVDNCDTKVVMPKPNMSQILRDEGLFSLPREYTGLKLEYARTQAILSQDLKRKRRSRSIQNLSHLDSEPIEGSFDAARYLSSDDLGLSSQSATCELVPSSQTSQLSGTEKRKRDLLLKRNSVENPTPNQIFPQLPEVNISREVTGESMEACSVSPETSKEPPRLEFTPKEHSKVSDLKSSQCLSLSHESPVKQGELLFSSQSPIVNRSLRRKLKRKKSLEKKRKKISNECSSKGLTEPADKIASSVNVENLVTVSISENHLDSSLMILSQSESLALDRTKDDDSKENQNLSQSLLKKFSPSSVLSGELSEQNIAADKLENRRKRKQFSDLKLSTYQRHDSNQHSKLFSAQEDPVPEQIIKLISDEKVLIQDALEDIGEDKVDTDLPPRADDQSQSPQLQVSRSNEIEIEIGPNDVKKASPISPIMLAQSIEELEWSQSNVAQVKEEGVSIANQEIQIASQILQQNVVEPGVSEINMEHQSVRRNNTEDDLKEISLSWFNEDMISDDKSETMTSHEFAHPNDVPSTPKDVIKVLEEKEETLFPDSLEFLNYNTMDLILEDDIRKETKSRIIDLSTHLNGRIEVQRMLIIEHQDRMILCLVMENSVDFFATTPFSSRLEVLSRFDRRVGDHGEQQVLFVSKNDSEKLSVCLKSYVCQNNEAAQSSTLQEFSYGFLLNPENLNTSRRFCRRILILHEPRLMDSFRCLKMSENFSLISYFLPGLNLTRIHLLHYERDLGPRIQAQHLLSLQARVVQLLLLRDTSSTQFVSVCEGSARFFSLQFSDKNVAKWSERLLLREIACDNSSIVAFHREKNGDFSFDQLTSDGKKLQRFAREKDRNTFFWEKDFGGGELIKSVEHLTSSTYLTLSQNGASIWDLSNDNRSKNFMWKFVFRSS